MIRSAPLEVYAVKTPQLKRILRLPIFCSGFSMIRMPFIHNFLALILAGVCFFVHILKGDLKRHTLCALFLSQFQHKAQITGRAVEKAGGLVRGPAAGSFRLFQLLDRVS